MAGTPESDQELNQQESTQTSRTLPGQKITGPDGQKKDSVVLSQEAEEIRQLQARDREVRAHEAAHAAVGGAYAGAPTYSFQRGPDGTSYAVGGEVRIDVSPISGDPEATMQKAQQVQAAALAPAEPSAQDLKVAQRAEAMAAKARTELAEQAVEEVPSLDIDGTRTAEETNESTWSDDRKNVWHFSTDYNSAAGSADTKISRIDSYA